MNTRKLSQGKRPDVFSFFLGRANVFVKDYNITFRYAEIKMLLESCRYDFLPS